MTKTDECSQDPDPWSWAGIAWAVAALRHSHFMWPAILLVFASCAADQASPGSTTQSTTQAPPTTAGSSTSTSMVSAESGRFPTALFAGLGDEPVSDELAAELQEVLDASANGHGLTATLISPQGIWNGATGFAAGDRAMVPNDQMSIASVTKTLVAAQVMQLVEAGELSLDDLAADRLPPDLEFDTNGATIAISSRCAVGFPRLRRSDGLWESLLTDPLRAWTPDEGLPPSDPNAARSVRRGSTSAPIPAARLDRRTSHRSAARRGAAQRGPRRRGVRAPDLSARRAADRSDGDAPRRAGRHLRREGGYLPSLAPATLFTSEGAMASDSLSLARWFRALCAGQVVSAASLDEMTDFDERPEYGLGIWDRREITARSPGLWATWVCERGIHGPRRCAFRIQAPSSWRWRTHRARRRHGRWRPVGAASS